MKKKIKLKLNLKLNCNEICSVKISAFHQIEEKYHQNEMNCYIGFRYDFYICSVIGCCTHVLALAIRVKTPFSVAVTQPHYKVINTVTCNICITCYCWEDVRKTQANVEPEASSRLPTVPEMSC